MEQRIETERLILRRWRASDLASFADLCADADVMHWIGNGSLRTRAECEQAIQRFESGWVERGFDLFAAEDKSCGRFIGFCGLSIPTFLPEILPAVEIGWRFEKAHWGRGLATEAAQASMSYAFDILCLDTIVSIHQVGNDASARIMRKLGMHFHKETVDQSCSRSVRIYTKERSD